MDAQVLSVFVGEDDKWGAGLLYPAIVDRLKEIGVDGVTVLHGIEGFGAHHKLHTSRFEVLFQGLPIVIEAIDTKEKIAEAVSAIGEMVTEGLVTVHSVKAIRYTKSEGG